MLVLLAATTALRAQQTQTDTKQWAIPAEIEPVKAPFDMPQPVRPTFPDRRISIRQTDAKQQRLCTRQIQKAIDKLAAKGGGTVIVPEGVWQTGRITLKSNIRLHLERGAELHFSGMVKDYLPVVLTRNEGNDLYSLGAMVYARDAENIALTGQGKLVSPEYSCEIAKRQHGGISPEVEKLPVERRVFDGSGGEKVFMPVFFGPINCRNVLVEGVTFERAIFWNIVPTYCTNTIIRGVTVSSHGHGRTDGIDIDSSVNSLIEYTTLDCGDDCFTLKSGRGNDGADRARPTENVVIRHCRVKRGVGGITIGSETAAGVNNVYATDVVMEQPMFPFYIKTRRPRGGGGRNFTFENITVEGSKRAAIYFDMLGSKQWVGKLAERLPAQPIGRLTPEFRDITFRNIEIKNSPMLISAKGLPERPIENIVMENIKTNTWRMTLQDVGKIDIRK